MRRWADVVWVGSDAAEVAGGVGGGPGSVLLYYNNRGGHYSTSTLRPPPLDQGSPGGVHMGSRTVQDGVWDPKSFSWALDLVWDLVWDRHPGDLGTPKSPDFTPWDRDSTPGDHFWTPDLTT